MLVATGNGMAFWETGTEGVFWSVLDRGQSDSVNSGLYTLEDGDVLTIYERDEPDRVAWCGTIDFEYESHQEVAFHNPNYRAQAVFQHWVHGLQRNVDAERWATYFFDEYPMQLQRACGWQARRSSENVTHAGSLQRLSNRDEVALLTLVYKLQPAHGTACYFSRQDRWVAMNLHRNQIEGLRDTCDAILAQLPHD